MDTTVEQVKYPRTAHLPFSPGATSDDKFMKPEGITYLKSGINLIVTEKMDGSNLTFTRNHFFGRSLDSTNNHWDLAAKSIWGQIRFDIPEGWRISGENMYARKSVAYENLPGYYIVFGIWDETNTLISWKETIEWAELFNLPTVPTLYEGNSYEEATQVWYNQKNETTSEGFVIRDSGKIHYSDFPTKVGKMVRANHVRTADNWRHRDDYTLNTFIKK